MSVTLLSGVVKQVVSGDTIVIRDKPKNCAPNVKTIVMMNVIAPKIGRKWKDGEDKDKPFAWEAREFLRKKLIGQEVWFFCKPFPPNERNAERGPRVDREQGKIFFPTKDDDITEELVANGLAEVKKERGAGKQSQEPSPDMKRLLELEEKAKREGKGIWSKDKEKHIRNVKYIKDGFTEFAKQYGKKSVSAIIENVRDGQLTMMLDVILLPNFHSIPFAISGIKFVPDSDEFKEEAKFFVECRLLQQNDIEVVIEKPVTSYVYGSIIHPKGNIAELLLREGFVSVDERTIKTVTTGGLKLYEAERFAKEKRLRCWKNRPVPIKTTKTEFQAIVCEIRGAESLVVKNIKTGESKKIFLSSIRGPKESRKEGSEETNSKDRRREGNEETNNRDRRREGGDETNNKDRARPLLFQIPWLFEAREFLRKKLIGKKVNVIVDFEQPKRNDFPAKTCCTVMLGDLNIAEALVQNGLATVVRYRSDEENCASNYEALRAAEQKAVDNGLGVHGKAKSPQHRHNEWTGNYAIRLFPTLSKNLTAIVEYVFSGTRMKLYIPKESASCTFLLSGIHCPRPGNSAKSGGNRASQPADDFGEEALQFTRNRVMQREVDIQIEQHDKFGSMIGTLIVGNTNLALALVEEGLALVLSTTSDRTLIQAEKVAKEKKLGIHQKEPEEKENVNENDKDERELNYKDVTVTVVSPELRIYAQQAADKTALAELEDKLRADLKSNPVSGFTKERPPLKGKLHAAKFSEDNLWYRGRVEKVMGGSSCKTIVYFVDYGNRETVLFEDLASLPDAYSSSKPFAQEYGLACVSNPPEHYQQDVALELSRELAGRNLRMNVEYSEHNVPFVTLFDPETKEDCVKMCIAKGMFYAQDRREKKLKSLVAEYFEAQEEAKKTRQFIWEFGDARPDEAREFGSIK